MSGSEVRARRAVAADVEGMLEVKRRLRVRPGESTPAGGFLLGSSEEVYRLYVERASVFALDDAETGAVGGFAIALPDPLLRASDVWARRGEIGLAGDEWGAVETARVGYFEQLAVLPEPRYRRHAAPLALLAVLDLLDGAHEHLFATVVREPFHNRASLRLLDAVGARRVGRIEEHYESVGRILSDVYHLDLAEAASRGPLASTRLGLRLTRRARRLRVGA